MTRLPPPSRGIERLQPWNPRPTKKSLFLMPQDNAVFQGFWINRHQTFPNRWFLTLSDGKAVLFQLFLGIYILYAGDRTWVFLRKRAIPAVHSSSFHAAQQQSDDVWTDTLGDGDVELGDPTNADADDPLPSTRSANDSARSENEVLSPKEVIQAYLGLTSDKPRLAKLWREDYSPKVRKTLFIYAVLLCLLTAILAPLLPWLLSDQSNKNPLVVSKWTPGCGRDENDIINAIERLRRLNQAERQYVECRSAQGCPGHPFQDALPPLTITTTGCPFEKSVCMEGVPTARVQHDLFPSHLGFNTNLEISFQHALSCTPIHLDSFLIFAKPKHSEGCTNGISLFDGSPLDYLEINRYMTILCTTNGPNRWSSNFSGWDGDASNVLHIRDFSLEIMPETSPNTREEQKEISQSLYREDGTTFVTLFRAGRTAFSSGTPGSLAPILDPIFGAHRSDKFEPGYYVPDREVTALACLEQYRFCHPSHGCSNWIGALLEDWNIEGNVENQGVNRIVGNLPMHLQELFLLFFYHSSVQLFVHSYAHFIIAELTHAGRRVWGIDNIAQWQKEMRAWFETAFLYARNELWLKIVPERKVQTPVSKHSLFTSKDFCGRLLFHDPSYTNFNVFWLVFALFPLSIPVVWHGFRRRFYWGIISILVVKCGRFCYKTALTLWRVLIYYKNVGFAVRYH